MESQSTTNSGSENPFEKHDMYDLADLEMLSRNDDALMRNLLGILISMFETESDNICKYAGEHKWKDVAEVAHKLKTSVTHIRAEAVRLDIIELEDYTGKSHDELTALADRVCKALAAMRSYLQDDLARFNAAKSAQ